MAENSKIEWTDHTFNPWMGCVKVSPACANCYAERDMDHRYGKVAWGASGTRVKTSVENWNKPIRWNRDAIKNGTRPRVFCASLADVFEAWAGHILDASGDVICRPYLDSENTPEFWVSTDADSLQRDPQGWSPITLHDLRHELFKLIDATPQLDWLLLTKRPENVEKMWPTEDDGHNGKLAAAIFGKPGRLIRRRDNVWLGTSIENQEWTDKRLPHLHAAKRNGIVGTTFVSAEPLVGPVKLQGHHGGLVYNHLGEGGIDWVITGGESGPNARPCKPEWFRSLRDQCLMAGIAFHFKQWGEFDETETRVGKKNAGRLLDGRTHDGLPQVVAI
jgi:protein gp37